MKKMKKRLKFRLFVELKSPIDEYSAGDRGVAGLFLPSGYCLFGVMAQPPHWKYADTREGESYAVILFNRALGVWRDPDPQLPCSWFGGRV